MLFKSIVTTIRFHKNSLRFIISIVLSSVMLITLNYYTITILSATRVYATGAANYIIAEKEAVRAIIQFIETGNPIYYSEFQKEMSTPISNGRFRAGVENNIDKTKLYQYWINGRNQPEDFKDAVFLLKNLRFTPNIKEALHQWRSADTLTQRINTIAQHYKEKSSFKLITNKDKSLTSEKILLNSGKLSEREKAFSRLMGDLNRLLKVILLWINAGVSLFIIGMVTLYATRMINKERRAKGQIEELSRMKDKFIAVASHELKTPVTTIKASMQIVEQGLLHLKDIKSLHPIIMTTNNQITRLTHIINDLLDMSGIRNNQFEIRKDYFVVEEVLTDAIVEIHSVKKTKQIVVQGNTKFEVFADKSRIQQVLVNLLSNAIKYSDEKKEIVIKVEKSDKFLRVSVRDFGIGIPPDKQKQIFDPFFRVHEKSDKFSGLGIGLYISSEIIKKHNGTIGVISKENKGSVFWFKIPISIPKRNT